MAKQKNANGKISHCSNKAPLDHPAMEIWKKRLAEKKEASKVFSKSLKNQ